MQKWLIGVDEAGRGPLAGPVAVGVAAVPIDFDWERIPGVGDSKKVTPKNREAIFRRAKELNDASEIKYSVVMQSAEVIDTVGIVEAVRLSIAQGFEALALSPEHTVVKLDGLLRAPDAYLNQETIVRGDATLPIIGLASILAKVTRDQHITALADEPSFSLYGFAEHKGYGTKKHLEAIALHGLSTLHRRSYCRKFAE